MDAERRGIVLEVGTDHLVVLTPDGAFLRVPRAWLRRGGDVGDEVTFSWAAERAARPIWLRRAGTAAAVAAIALAAVGASLTWPGSEAAYAHVSIDLAPGVTADLAVDAQGRVIRAYGTQGAAELLRKARVQGKDLSQAVRELVQPAIQNGQASPAVVVAVAASRAHGTAPQALAGELRAAKDAVETDARTKGRAVAVIGLDDDAHHADSLREQAQAHGLSLGEYLLYLEAAKQGAKVDLQAVKDLGVWDALREAGLSPDDIAEKIWNDKDLSGSPGRGDDPRTHGNKTGDGASRNSEDDRGHGAPSQPGKDGHGDGHRNGNGHGASDGGSTKGSDEGHGHASTRGQDGAKGHDHGKDGSGGTASPSEGAKHSDGGQDRGRGGRDSGGVPGQGERGSREGDPHIRHDDSVWRQLGDFLKGIAPWGDDHDRNPDGERND
ncbi:MAG: hypothetical protein IRZ18_01150 [Clostridia bacterium]|nr:hypothetical protein [Clostridia bacterium]